MLQKFIAALLCAIACLSTAQAHITLEQKSAVAGSTYKAIFRVGHGCEGSPTTAITVFVPEGFTSAKPMPKAGWKLDIKREKPDAIQLSWNGGRLPDAEYDEFVINMSLPATPGKRSIRVLQQCESGQTDWAEIAVDGQAKPRYPAPVLDILPAAPAAMPEHHH